MHLVSQEETLCTMDLDPREKNTESIKQAASTCVSIMTESLYSSAIFYMNIANLIYMIVFLSLITSFLSFSFTRSDRRIISFER